MEQLFFAGKAYLKINSLVKTPLHEFMAVERSELWAPVGIYRNFENLFYCHRFWAIEQHLGINECPLNPCAHEQDSSHSFTNLLSIWRTICCENCLHILLQLTVWFWKMKTRN